MNKKEFPQWKRKISVSALADNSIVVHYDLWNLANEILETGEITDELFKRIGAALVNKMCLYGSIERIVKNEYA